MSQFDQFSVRVLLPILLVALALAAYLTFVGESTNDFSVSDRFLDGGQASRDVLAPFSVPPSSPSIQYALRVGDQFRSLEELDAAQNRAGFVRVGLFGDHWPGRITEVQNDRNGIHFVRDNGTPHTYSEFTGYLMQVIRMRSGADETLVVYRSMNKEKS